MECGSASDFRCSCECSDFGACAFIKGESQGLLQKPLDLRQSHLKHVCWSCLVAPPCPDVSLGCMLEGCVAVDDFSRL